MTQFVNVSFLCVPVHEDTTRELLGVFVVSKGAVKTRLT